MAPKKQKVGLLQYFKEEPNTAKAEAALSVSLSAAGVKLKSLTQEICFNINVTGGMPLKAAEENDLHWLLAETFEPTLTRKTTFLKGPGSLLEVGPRLAFCTAWSTNAVSICEACGLGQIDRIERSRRYLVVTEPQLSAAALAEHAEAVHDRMTECVYTTPLSSFVVEEGVKPVVRVPLLKEGRAALQKISDELGFGFDEADLDYYTDVFVNKLQRDPTDVELFDIGQSNSEHSRHWCPRLALSRTPVAAPCWVGRFVWSVGLVEVVEAAEVGGRAGRWWVGGSVGRAPPYRLGGHRTPWPAAGTLVARS